MDLIQSLKNSENLRQDLIDIKNTMTDENISQIIENESYFLELISSDDSKIRKAVNEILGKTKQEKYKSIIFNAYLNEQQLMIKSSILKALEGQFLCLIIYFPNGKEKLTIPSLLVV